MTKRGCQKIDSDNVSHLEPEKESLPNIVARRPHLKGRSRAREQ